MNLLAVMSSYRKGKTIDTLMDRAIEGALSNGNVHVNKVVLVDKKILYCRNCMTCRNEEGTQQRARCVISDDMDSIYPLIDSADGYIFGTPVNIGAVTAIMKTFLERICWVFAKPGRWPLPGCPTPRTKKRKKAILIVSSGIVPALLRRFDDDATPLIKSVCRDSLNAKLIGSLYAGAVEKGGMKRYLNKAYKLGKRLTS